MVEAPLAWLSLLFGWTTSGPDRYSVLFPQGGRARP
jgi:hypothetical protein